MPDEFVHTFSETNFSRWRLLTDDYFDAGFTTYFGSEEKPSWSLNSWHTHGLNAKSVDFSWWPVYKLHFGTAPVRGTSEFCLGNAPFHRIVIDHIREFTATSHVRSFLVYMFSELTHEKQERLRLIDDDFAALLRAWHVDGYLNDTILVLVGDHGPRFTARRFRLFGFFEERLPLAMITVPPRFKAEFPALYTNLALNEHRLTSHFDLHKTLLHLLPANLHNSSHFAEAARAFPHGRSLFEAMPLERTCAEAGIPSAFCACDRMQSVSIDDQSVVNSAFAIVARINVLLEVNELAAKNCSTLVLRRVIAAAAFERGGVLARRETTVRFRSITVETTPGGAIFRAKIREERWLGQNSSSFVVIGDIARLNRYGEQSACIAKARDGELLKKFCYCSAAAST